MIEWSRQDRTPRVLGECLASQTAVHVQHGGIVPSVARDLHTENIANVVNSCMAQTGLEWRQLSAVAVTTRPGLALSLKVGLVFAKDLARRFDLPLIPVHHMHAHALTVRLLGQDGASPTFPFVTLLLSGGHALLAVARGVDDFLLLGRHLDISPGDCLDKFARRLGLVRSPLCNRVAGGRAVEIMAGQGGNPHAFPFTTTRQHDRDCDFSFSGLQSRAIALVGEQEQLVGLSEDGIVRNAADLCASVQLALTKAICKRLQRGLVFCELQNVIPPEMEEKTIVVAGGVASNSFIRRCLEVVADSYGYRLVCPPPRLCTDNGVMIAWTGLELARLGQGVCNDLDALDFVDKAPIGEDVSEAVRSCHIKPKKLKLPTGT